MDQSFVGGAKAGGEGGEVVCDGSAERRFVWRGGRLSW